MKLRDFVPPILIKLAKRSMESSGLFDSHESALAICNGGYENERIVEVVYKKTRRYRDVLISQKPLVFDVASLRTFVGLNLAISDKELNVIDFGGACGAHYFLAKALFGNRINIRWNVVETPRMVNIACGLADGYLNFFNDLEKAKNQLGRIDLMFSSGALQYAANPYKSLTTLTECNAKNIFITRVGLSTSSSELITIQKSNLSANGPGSMPESIPDEVIKYPVTFVKKDKFEEIINRNYSIQIQFIEEQKAYMADKYFIDMYGYFGLLNTSGA